jgi:ABC-type antimicrobial peptide transport system permease subunit
MIERLMMAVAGFFIGGFLGWFMGVAWYELVEIPKAAPMDPATDPSYLCATGDALSLLAFPGAILGAIVGARKNRASVRKVKHGQDHTVWFI